MAINTNNTRLTVKPQEFSILSIISHSNESLDLKSRLKLLIYLTDEELDDKYNIYSYSKGNVGPEPKNMNNHLESLSDKGIITIKTTRTFGGDKRYEYSINQSHRDIIDELTKRTDDANKLHTIIGDIHNKYGDIPISNLMAIVRKEYPLYFQNNTETWY